MVEYALREQNRRQPLASIDGGLVGAAPRFEELHQLLARAVIVPLAIALNAAGNRADATKHLLEIVRRDRKWNEDGARKQLVQFFESWGPADEATVEGRKRLSTVLFS